MKTSRIFKLMGIALVGLALASPVEAIASRIRLAEKNAITLTVDKPVVEFMAKANADQIDAKDIVRMQKMAGQIDYLAVSFRDEDASDYILKFKSLDAQGLEAWMFNEGYLKNAPESTGVSQEMSARPETVNRHFFKGKRKSLSLTIDTPIIEYLARIYADQIETDDIFRLQKLCRQIDHITVAFRDEDASDYVLKFKCLDDKALEKWMFSEGYLVAKPEPAPAPAPAVIEPWMLDPEYLE